MKKIRILFMISIFTGILFAYEQGKIDMHGGKGDSLNSNKGFSSNFDSLLIEKKKKELSEEEKKILEKQKKESGEKL